MPVAMPVLSLALITVLPLAAVELAKAARWRTLLGPSRPSYLICLRALVAGQLTNALSPVRAGEAVRLAWFTAQGGALVPGAAALAGVKAIDSVCLAAIAAGVIGLAAFAHSRLALAAAGVVLATGIALAIHGHAVRSWLERSSLARRLRLVALVDVATTIHDPRALAVVLVCTSLVWGSGLLANAVVLAVVGAPVTLDLCARVIVAGYLSALLPAPPVRLGVFEGAITVALTTGGVPLAQAITAAVTLHVCQLAELGLLMGGSMLARRWGWWAWSS